MVYRVINYFFIKYAFHSWRFLYIVKMKCIKWIWLELFNCNYFLNKIKGRDIQRDVKEWNKMAKQQKYVVIDSNDEVYETESKRTVITPTCIWTSVRTVILLTIYFAPSVILTFYQRWLLQVKLVYIFYLSAMHILNCITYVSYNVF